MSCSTLGEPPTRHENAAGAAASANGSRPPTRIVGEPCSCAEVASSGERTSTRRTTVGSCPIAVSASPRRVSAISQFGQSSKYTS